MYICDALHILRQGRTCQFMTGIFYACYLHTAVSYLRVGTLMRPLLSECKATGKAEPLFFCPSKTTIMKHLNLKDLENKNHKLMNDLQTSFERENELFKMSVMASTNLTLAMQKHNQIEMKLNKTRKQTLLILEQYLKNLNTLKTLRKE